MTALSAIQPMQRSRGAARVSFGLSQGRPVLRDMGQQGSAKVILPHVGMQPEVVFLNTSGGLTGGDTLSYAVDLAAGVRACATTQTAERAYRSTGPAAHVSVKISVGAGGFVEWLPQETILFQASNLDRRTEVTLAPGAGCLLLESVVLGRAAMGETLTRVALTDRREVWRNATPVMVEPLRLNDTSLQTGPAGLGGARAFASIALIAPDAADLLASLRQVLDEPGVRAAASALPARLMVRLAAADGWPLRRQIARCLAILRRGQPLPRVWQM